MREIEAALKGEVESRIALSLAISIIIEATYCFGGREKVRLNEPLSLVSNALNLPKTNALGVMVKEAMIAKGAWIVRLRGRDYYRGVATFSG